MRIAATLIGLIVSVQAIAINTTVTVNSPHPCVASSMRYYLPSGTTNPITFLQNFKQLTATVVCTLANSNFATCGSNAAPVNLLAASASSAQIGMSPSCSWNCGGCAANPIVTDGSDGLPVELLELRID